MEFIKNNFKYLVLFVFFLLIYVVLCYVNTSYDVIWEYGFSHAIRIGEVPYRDFNTISTPLYIFLMSLGLFIYDGLLTYLVEQALFMTVLFYLFFKMFDKKAWLILPVMAFPLFQQFNGTYNFLCLFLVVLLIYLEENKKSDYVIGVVLGLLILSKQTIGLPILIFSCIGIRNIKSIGKRIVACIIPVIVFFIYLIGTGSLEFFIDLCFLGLFDFGTSNGNYLGLGAIVCMVIVLGLLYLIIKNPKKINYYYVLGSFFFAFPIFDFCHMGYFMTIVFLLILPQINLKHPTIFSAIMMGVLLGMNILVTGINYSEVSMLRVVPKFEEYVQTKTNKKKIINVYNKYLEYKKRDALMVGEQAMFYDIAVNNPITYFDVTLRGNYGYNGTNKMIQKVKNIQQQIFFIDMNRYKYLNDKNQLDKKLIKYIIEHSKKIDDVENYVVYLKE